MKEKRNYRVGRDAPTGVKTYDYLVSLYINNDVYEQEVIASRVNITETAVIFYDEYEHIQAIFPIHCTSIVKVS